MTNLVIARQGVEAGWDFSPAILSFLSFILKLSALNMNTIRLIQ